MSNYILDCREKQSLAKTAVSLPFTNSTEETKRLIARRERFRNFRSIKKSHSTGNTLVHCSSSAQSRGEV